MNKVQLVPVSAPVGYMEGRASSSKRPMLDGVLAGLALVLVSPLLLVVSVLIWLADGRPVLWGGKRLGYGGRPFTMYKFRTLRRGSDRVIGASVLTRRLAADLSIENALGHFLRETHLDELPQFWNVLLGDMCLLGPRPLRPEVYQRVRTELPGYEWRLSVCPGLFGHSQFYLPHDTSKRIQDRLERAAVRHRRSFGSRLGFIVVGVARLTARLAAKLARCCVRIVLPRAGRCGDRRRFQRLRPPQGRARFQLIRGGQRELFEVPLRQISETELVLRWPTTDAPAELTSGETLPLELTCRYQTWLGGRRREKRALISGRICAMRPRYPDGSDMVVTYECRSQFTSYLIKQYFLRESLL